MCCPKPGQFLKPSIEHEVIEVIDQEAAKDVAHPELAEYLARKHGILTSLFDDVKHRHDEALRKHLGLVRVIRDQPNHPETESHKCLRLKLEALVPLLRTEMVEMSVRIRESNERLHDLREQALI